jgi:septal ring factor EnvC (AmiA/AmiB activator)
LRIPLLLALLLGCALPAAAAEDPRTAQREIERITKKLNDLSAWFSDAEKTQRDWQKELKRTDEAIAATGRDIRALEKEMTALESELAALESERTKLEAAREAQATSIAEHLAAAYRLQGQDFFKMLLNQEDPERLERMIRYHHYFSEARADSLAEYGHTIEELATNTETTRAREGALRDRQQTLAGERSALVAKRKERERHLAQLSSDMRGKTKEREGLKKDRGRLEQLLTEITRRAERVTGAFATTKGKLPWPVLGPVRHAFGTPRADGHLRWQGLFIGAAEGTAVAAVHRGRIAFADWLRGFGLLTIVDHGNGFMSLYAHADVVYKKVGDWVDGGDVIATAGKSGGQSEPGLYFEIRAKGSPVDPILWLRRRGR